MTESMIGFVGTGFFALFVIVANWMIFQKAGIPGWKSLIPVYNAYLQFKICWKGWVGLLSLALAVAVAVMTVTEVSIVYIAITVVFSVIIQTIFCFKLAKAFGRGVIMGLILTLTAGLGRIILGFGNSRYVGNMA